MPSNDQTAEIRAWGRDNGWELSDSGRLPAAVVAAWEAATGQEPPPGAPDWGAAREQLSAAPAAGPDPLADEPGDEPGAAGAGEAGPPPVASLDEARERIGAQGAARPSWAPRGAPRPPKNSSNPQRAGRKNSSTGRKPAVIPATVKADIAGKLALLLAIPAAAWEAVDPECGGAFSEQSDVIVTKLVPLICQSPAAVAFLSGGTNFILLLDLMVALQPVGAAFYRHHLSPEARERKEAERRGGGPPRQGGQQAAAPDLDDDYPAVQVPGHAPAYRAV